MILAKVYVTLKPSVLDSQGAVVQRALADVGFAGVTGVRMGKYLEVTLQTGDRAHARAQVQRMGERLLSNPVIETFRFDLSPLPSSTQPPKPKAARIARR